MGKYVLGTLFVLMLALNVGAYVFFVREIDGSKVTTKRAPIQPQQPGRERPTR